jgi:hypothetical protein
LIDRRQPDCGPTRGVGTDCDFDSLGRDPEALAQVIADGLSALLGDPFTFRSFRPRNDLRPQAGMPLEYLADLVE